jgi:hypothetical protein
LKVAPVLFYFGDSEYPGHSVTYLEKEQSWPLGASDSSPWVMVVTGCEVRNGISAVQIEKLHGWETMSRGLGIRA